MSIELVNCIRCGCKPEEINFGSVTEIAGVSHQDVDIYCCHDDCPVSVFIGFDSENPHADMTALISNMWNDCNRATT